MDTPEEIIEQGIASMLETPERDFAKEPLTQEELQVLIEQLMKEVSDPKIEKTLAQYYLSCITFLKTKMLYN
jgi:hypothetical protein